MFNPFVVQGVDDGAGGNQRLLTVRRRGLGPGHLMEATLEVFICLLQRAVDGDVDCHVSPRYEWATHVATPSVTCST